LVSFFRGKSPTTADYLAKSNQTITTSKCGDEIGQPFIPATRTREPLDELPTESTLPTLSATASSSFVQKKANRTCHSTWRGWVRLVADFHLVSAHRVSQYLRLVLHAEPKGF
jgi:hypothetical protein